MKRPKYGTSFVPGRLKPGCGTQKPKYGTSREIRDGWQAYGIDRQTDVRDATLYRTVASVRLLTY